MACIITYENKQYTQKEFEQYFKEHFTEFVGEFTSITPDVILPIGTSGSGKSTFIKSLPQENLVVIEPDAMRVEFTGNMNDKSKDKEIYIEAANRAIKAIKQGKQVVFDTTNLTKDKRLPFIEAIKKAMPTANIQYKLMELNPELAKQRIKAQLERGENRAAVSDETIDRHAESYKQMLEDIKNEPISEYKELGSKQDIEGFKDYINNVKSDEVIDYIYDNIDYRINFEQYFPEYSYLSEEERQVFMQGVESGDITITCTV
jgi:predicted kinase